MSKHRRATLRTRAVRSTTCRTREGTPLSQPVYQTAAYGFAESADADARFASGQAVYARDGLPNVRALEGLVADLEGAEDAIAVSSGMAALSLILFTLLQSGDHVVAPEGCYRDTTVLLAHQFSRFGITASFVDPNDPAAIKAALTDRTRLIVAETISNPGMTLTNLPHLAAIAATHHVLFCVDNTFATPALCRPIEHGADIVFHSAGKFLGGHHDVTAGVVVGRHDLVDPMRRAAYLLGPTLAPMEAWLTVRGIKTLAPRMRWISDSAAEIADALARHPAVAAVRYPGRPAPDHDAESRQILPAGHGGLMAFDLCGGDLAAERFIRGLQTIPYAPTVGGCSTIVSYPPQADAVAFGIPGEPQRYHSPTIRLSIGLEDPADIWDDLKQALDAVSDAELLTRQP